MDLRQGAHRPLGPLWTPGNIAALRRFRVSHSVVVGCRARRQGYPAVSFPKGRPFFFASPLEGEVDRPQAGREGGALHLLPNKVPPSPSLPLKGGGGALSRRHVLVLS